jgi:hypothetical protein
LTFLCCLFWAGAMLRPALVAPRERIVMDIGDPVLNASILEWNARTLPLTRAWWNFPAFAPAQGMTAFTEHLLGLYPLSTPLVWLTGNPVLTYDLLCLLSFPLAGVSMFALARRLTGSSVAAAAGAIAFAFAPYRMSHLSHLQMLWTFGIPIAVLGLHRWVDDRSRTGLALFAAGWLVTAASNGYLMVFFGVYLLFWIAWSCTTKAAIDRLPAVAAVGLLSSLPLVPVLLGYVDVHGQYQLRRSALEVASYGADVTGIVRQWAGAGFVWPWFEPVIGEGAIYPGLGIVTLAIAGVLGSTHAVVAGSRRSRWVSRALLATALLFLSAAVIAAFTSVRYELGFARLSISNPARPLIVGLLALLAAAATTGRGDAVLRARSPVLFHALIVPVIWVLSLGPAGRVNGVEVLAGLPYAWLLRVPGLTALRVPARFWLLATFSLAVLASYGVARLITRDGTRSEGRRGWLHPSTAAICVALIVVEAWTPVAGAPVNPFPVLAPATRDDGPVLEVPFDRVDQNSVAVLRAVTGGYRTINGYSGFEPPHFVVLRTGVRLREAAVLDELRRWTPFQISVAGDEGAELRTWLTRTQPQIRLVAEAGGHALYAIPALPRGASSAERPSRGEASALPFRITRASCGHVLVPDAQDGSLVTRWECGPGRPGQFLETDLGTARSISGIINSLGPYATDAPRSLHIAVSDDGSRWTTAWEGSTGALAMRAAFEAPARMDVRVTFEPVSGRYLRITQTGDETNWYWSVAELKIIGD